MIARPALPAVLAALTDIPVEDFSGRRISLADAGGEKYLVQQSKKNPVAFMTLVGRVLPLQVKEGGDEPRVPTVVNHIYEK